MHPRQHVAHVSPWVVRMHFNRAWHAAGATACERAHEALERGVVTRIGDLLRVHRK